MTWIIKPTYLQWFLVSNCKFNVPTLSQGRKFLNCNTTIKFHSMHRDLFEPSVT